MRQTPMPRTRRVSSYRAVQKGEYRSGLEKRVATQIEETTGRPVEYEKLKLAYTKPAHAHKYNPDFELPNGIIVECKGRFEAKDREKHLLVKEQHPDRDIRFVFSRSAAPLYKGSPTTYAAWCEKHGFKYADKLIPLAWFKEKKVA
jgi:hypothetical protein